MVSHGFTMSKQMARSFPGASGLEDSEFEDDESNLSESMQDDMPDGPEEPGRKVVAKPSCS